VSGPGPRIAPQWLLIFHTLAGSSGAYSLVDGNLSSVSGRDNLNLTIRPRRAYQGGTHGDSGTDNPEPYLKLQKFEEQHFEVFATLADERKHGPTESVNEAAIRSCLWVCIMKRGRIAYACLFSAQLAFHKNFGPGSGKKQPPVDQGLRRPPVLLGFFRVQAESWWIYAG